jgi:SRSO17 transposase
VPRFGKVEQKVPVGVVLADAGYGSGTPFRAALSHLGLQCIVGTESSTTVWEPGQQPLPALAPQQNGRLPGLHGRKPYH